MDADKFIELAKEGDADGVAKALADGMDVNTVGGVMENPALFEAAQAGHMGTLKVLLDAGADPNARGWGGCTALMVCSGLEMLEALLDAGADPLLKNDDCETALSMSEESLASLEAMQEAIDGGHMAGEAGQYWPPSEQALAFHERLKELTNK